MQEYIGSELSKVGTFGEWLVTREPCALGIGGQTVQLYILPVSWAGQIDELYGSKARHQESHKITVRQLREQEIVGRIIMDAVDEDWRPLQFGVVMLGDSVAAYAVPAVPYWRARVESGEER